MFEAFDSSSSPGPDDDCGSGDGVRPAAESPVNGAGNIFDQRPDGGLLDVLCVTDPLDLDPGDQVRYVKACARLESQVVALKLIAVEAVSRNEETAAVGVSGFAAVVDPGREEVMTALHVSAIAASSLVDQAQVLVRNSPQTLYALSEGLISPAVARVISQEMRHLDCDQVAQVENHVLVRAGHQTPSDARRCVARAVAKAAPEVFAEQVTEAVKTRTVEVIPQPHGMALFQALLPSVTAMDLFSMVDEHARVAKQIDREQMRASNGEASVSGGSGEIDELESIDAYRADALVALVANGPATLTGNLIDADTPAQSRRTADIVMDLPTLLGLANHPGELAGYGPIPASLARALAKDAQWRRMITDPQTGHLLELGRRTYVPSPALREYICARDQDRRDLRSAVMAQWR